MSPRKPNLLLKRIKKKKNRISLSYKNFNFLLISFKIKAEVFKRLINADNLFEGYSE